MTEETEKRPRKHRRMRITLAVVVLLLAAFIIPSMINVSRYKGRITQLVSQSLGRPVQISGIEMRLLPWPGFVLSNLVVDSDPAFGAEPVLHADSVVISFNLLALWSGRLQISRISVDDASLNLVRAPDGRWNLESLFRTAAAKAAGAARSTARRAPRLPYLEATDSRINFKNGVVKLPFSIVNANLAFWQAAPGDWHIRLRGQPARTDVSLDEEDTGIVRLNASLHSAPALRDMPLHVDMDWRQAQLGQLSRLLIGSDPGWRGALTAELHIDGTAETAHVTARLRATGVHRAEFAPAEPLDFDANCGLVYHYSRRALDDLVCNSPLGNGHIRLTGSLPGGGAQPRFTLALDRVPVDAGLAFLRTIRSGVDSGLRARGTISGKMIYAASAPLKAGQHSRPPLRGQVSQPLPLTGSFTVNGFRLSGGGLNSPIQAARAVFVPEQMGPNHALGLTAAATVRAGAATPLTLVPSLTLKGYHLAVRGPASLTWVKELARLTGTAHPAELDALSGGPVSLALNLDGPWLPNQEYEVEVPQTLGASHTPGTASAARTGVEPTAPSVDNLSGTVVLHDAGWKPDFLAHHAVISQATLNLDDGKAVWNPVYFAYGPVRGIASLALPEGCAVPKPCPAQFAVRFGNLNAGELQRAILGARQHISLFAALIDRLHLSSAPDWPRLDGTVRADSLVLGPVKLEDPVAELKIDSTGATISSLDARMLGGQLHAGGTLTKPGTDQGRPTYALNAELVGLSAPAVGRLFGLRFAGRTLNASGKIHLVGLTARELASSASGGFSFDWRQGGIAAPAESAANNRVGRAAMAGDASAGTPTKGPAPASAKAESEVHARAASEGGATVAVEAPGKAVARHKAKPIPAELTRFDRFSGEVEIADGNVVLRNGQVVESARRHSMVEAEMKLGGPLRIAFTVPRQTLTAKDKIKHPLK